MSESGEPAPDPWSAQRVTSAARRALTHAARLAKGRPVEPRQLYGALAALETSVAGRALELVGLSWTGLGVGGPGPRPLPAREPPGELDLDPGCRRFFELAAREARRLGHHPLGSGHLLLALLSGDAGPLPGTIERRRVARAVCAVLAEPWVHGWALDGEVCLYLTRDELLVLYLTLSRRTPRQAASLAERTLCAALCALMRPTIEGLLAGGLAPLERALTGLNGLCGANRVLRKADGSPTVEGHPGGSS